MSFQPESPSINKYEIALLKRELINLFPIINNLNMKKLSLLLLIAIGICCMNTFAQETKKDQAKKKTVQSSATSSNKVSVAKAAEKPEVGDKAIAGKKGPDGQKVYEGAKGGQYYINKNGNKTYLKEEDKVEEGKKGPDGQKVYLGPQGGEYYLNKSGKKVYLKNNTK